VFEGPKKFGGTPGTLLDVKEKNKGKESKEVTDLPEEAKEAKEQTVKLIHHSMQLIEGL
jgi:hypothetical protein